MRYEDTDSYKFWRDVADTTTGSSYTPAELSAYTAGYDAGEQEAYADAAEWREATFVALAAVERWRALAVVTLLALLIVAVWA